MEKFQSYLTKAISQFRLKKSDIPLRMCLGNVSADMDSLVGSMALSYYYYLKYDQYFIPVINSRKSDFYLKFEQVQHFNKCKLNENEHVIFRDELEPLEKLDIEEVALIDHNQLDKSQEAALQNKVTRIIDHHVDSNMYQSTLKEKQIELIGSATTLVVDRLIKEFPNQVDSQMAIFLTAPIVLDSFFFDESLKDNKWTNKDLEVYQYLNKLADVGKAYWQFYNDSKYDIELNLKSGLKNLLIKDYKTYSLLEAGQVGFGVSSIMLPLKLIHEHFGLESLSEEMTAIMKSKNLGIFGIVTNYPDEEGIFRKEILIYANPTIYSLEKCKFTDLIEHLNSHQGYELKNKDEFSSKDGGTMVQWVVGNLTYSRKNLEVLLKKFYE